MPTKDRDQILTDRQERSRSIGLGLSRTEVALSLLGR